MSLRSSVLGAVIGSIESNCLLASTGVQQLVSASERKGGSKLRVKTSLTHLVKDF